MPNDNEASLRAEFNALITRMIAWARKQGENDAFDRLKTFVERGAAIAAASTAQPAKSPAKAPADRAPAGAVKGAVEELLLNYATGGLIPSKIVELGKQQGKPLKESSVRMALFSLQKDGRAIQDDNKSWYHSSRAPRSGAGSASAGGHPQRSLAVSQH